MNKEKIVFSSKPLEISEYKDYKIATFLISVLDEYNKNGVMIQKAEGEKYHESIIGMPILAYLTYDEDGNANNFGGHEVRVRKDKDGKKEHYFATSAIGSVIESWIEEREVDGYNGVKSVILIKTKLWSSRFPEYFKVLDELWAEGKVSSSWEISVEKSQKTTIGKILKVFTFIGNTLLGNNIEGAVEGAGILEIAETNDDELRLAEALAKDVQVSDIESYNYNKEDEQMNKNKEIATITMQDLYKKLAKAIDNKTDSWLYLSIVFPEDKKCWAYKWDRESELDYLEFTYSVNSNDEVEVSDGVSVKLTALVTAESNPNVNIQVNLDDTAKLLSEKEITISNLSSEISTLKTTNGTLDTELSGKTDALVKAGEKIEELNATIAELVPFKEKVEESERIANEAVIAEKKENLKKLAVKGGFIATEELETSEEIKAFIESLDEKGIKSLIAERVISKLDQETETDSKKETEVSTVLNNNIKLNINNDEELNPMSIMSNYLNK